MYEVPGYKKPHGEVASFVIDDVVEGQLEHFFGIFYEIVNSAYYLC